MLTHVGRHSGILDHVSDPSLATGGANHTTRYCLTMSGYHLSSHTECQCALPVQQAEKSMHRLPEPPPPHTVPPHPSQKAAEAAAAPPRVLLAVAAVVGRGCCLHAAARVPPSHSSNSISAAAVVGCKGCQAGRSPELPWKVRIKRWSWLLLVLAWRLPAAATIHPCNPAAGSPPRPKWQAGRGVLAGPCAPAF